MKLRLPQKLCNVLSSLGTVFIQKIPDSVQLFLTADGAKIVMSDGTKGWEGTRGLSDGAVAVFVRTGRQKPRENSFQTESSPATYLLLTYSMVQSPSEKLF